MEYKQGQGILVVFFELAPSYYNEANVPIFSIIGEPLAPFNSITFVLGNANGVYLFCQNYPGLPLGPNRFCVHWCASTSTSTSISMSLGMNWNLVGGTLATHFQQSDKPPLTYSCGLKTLHGDLFSCNPNIVCNVLRFMVLTCTAVCQFFMFYLVLELMWMMKPIDMLFHLLGIVIFSKAVNWIFHSTLREDSMHG